MIQNADYVRKLVACFAIVVLAGACGGVSQGPSPGPPNVPLKFAASSTVGASHGVSASLADTRVVRTMEDDDV